MLATLIIVFREVLEAALIVTIVLAATRGVATRFRYVGAGIVAGLVGSLLVAGSADLISQAAEGVGQELFNAGILGLAVVMLGWHVAWMSRHGAALAAEMRSVGDAVSSGRRPLSVLAIVVALAVLREGSEVVLFLYGIAAAKGADAMAMALGGGLGVALGVAAGGLLYSGLVRVPVRHFFAATNWLIVLLAAGMAAHGADYLVRADIIGDLGGPYWDSSAILSEQSLVGQVLNTLVGYIARPSGVEILSYAVVVGGLALLMRIGRRQSRPLSGAAE